MDFKNARTCVRSFKGKAKPHEYGGPFAAKEITPDKRADFVNEKWPENLACCHKRIYLNICAAHDSFPLSTCCTLSGNSKQKSTRMRSRGLQN